VNGCIDLGSILESGADFEEALNPILLGRWYRAYQEVRRITGMAPAGQLQEAVRWLLRG
jgi:hypothetical protein